jgi:uncharacterized protein YlxW (UPF0749 family)
MAAILFESPYLLITWTSLFIAVLSFLYTLWSDKRSQHSKVQSDYVSQLENRIEALEREIKSAEEKIKALEDKHQDCMKENLELLRKIASSA